jgi:hypothetical protein
MVVANVLQKNVPRNSAERRFNTGEDDDGVR